jgi:uncharacterized protein (DUF697 family)
MNIIKGLSRLGVVLASLAVIAVTFASGASASTGMVPLPGPDNGPAGAPAPVTVVRTVVVGGMPGWQIASIAVVAALVTAIAAVLIGRTRTARRRPVRPLAQPISGPSL